MKCPCRFSVPKFKLKKKASYPLGPLVAYHERVSVWSETVTSLGSEGSLEITEAPRLEV